MGELLQGTDGIIAGVVIVLWVIRELAKLRKPNGASQQDLKEVKRVCYEILKLCVELHDWHNQRDDEGRLIWYDHRVRHLLVKMMKMMGEDETKM